MNRPNICHPEQSEGPWCLPANSNIWHRQHEGAYLPARGINISTGAFTPYTAAKLL